MNPPCNWLKQTPRPEKGKRRKRKRRIKLRQKRQKVEWDAVGSGGESKGNDIKGRKEKKLGRRATIKKSQKDSKRRGRRRRKEEKGVREGGAGANAG